MGTFVFVFSGGLLLILAASFIYTISSIFAPERLSGDENRF
jgi:hypothetical protein